MGLKGTVVSVPQAEQVVRVSGRTLGPPSVRFALHCLQRLGSLVNFLSKKNSCSPAVKTKSAPQSMHLRTLSWNSMAGFPEDGKGSEIGHARRCLPVPFPCLLPSFNNKGPGRNNFSGNLLVNLTK